MKNLVFVFISASILLFTSCQKEIFGCLKGKGDIVKQEVFFSEFTDLVIDIEARLIIKEGEIQKIEIEGHQNIIDRLLEDSKLTGDKLKIDIDGCSNTGDLTIYLTTKTLENLSVNGSIDASTDGPLTGLNDFGISISGSGTIDFNLQDANRVDINTSGSANIKLAGDATLVDISTSGSIDLAAYDLIAQEYNISVSGSADCQIAVEQTLDVDISGSGTICYRGNPAINFDNSGSGEVKSCN